MSSSSYKKYDSTVPLFLQNRPRNVVFHYLKRISSSLSINRNDIVRNQDLLSVKSDSTNQVHQVCFCNNKGFPFCSCEDFNNHFLHCKHMFAIFHKYEDISWDSLPCWYRESLFITLDGAMIKYYSHPTEMFPTTNDMLLVSKTSIASASGEELGVKSAKLGVLDNDTSPRSKVLNNIASLLAETSTVSFDISTFSALKKSEAGLKSILTEMLQHGKHEAVLRICNSTNKRSSKVKRKSSNGDNYDELPKKRKKKIILGVLDKQPMT